MSSVHILHWTVDHFYPRMILKTGFEPEGCVILSMLSKIVPQITVMCSEIDYQMQGFWNITGRLYRKTGLEITPIHLHHTNDEDNISLDLILDCTRRQGRPGIGVLGTDSPTEIPTVSPLVRWTGDALIQKLKQDAILDSSFINIWPTEHWAAGNERRFI